MTLDAFARQAAEAVAAPPDDPATQHGITPVEIAILIQVIAEVATLLLERCPQDSQQLARRAQSPTIRDLARFNILARRVVRERDAAFRWRRQPHLLTAGCQQVASQLTETELQAAIEDARRDYRAL